MQSSALDMFESRLGRAWNEVLLFCWWDEGRINAAKALLTKSPSTVPIRTREFVIADLLAFKRFEGNDVVWLFKFLWKLHRNEPGWFVGEHMHVLFWLFNGFPTGFFNADIEWLGDPGLSKLNRTDGDDTGEAPEKFSLVGEVDRRKKLDAGDEKVEVDEANAGDGLPEGEIDRRTGPLDFREETAIVVVESESKGTSILSENVDREGKEYKYLMLESRKRGEL